MTWLRRVRDGLASSWWGRILAEHDTEPVELLSGALKLALGVHLLLPWPTFPNNPRLYADMTVLPEWAWGIALIAISIGHLGALRDGAPSWRQWAAFTAFLVWIALGVTFVHTQPTALIGPTLLLFALASGWCYVRLGILRRARVA